VKDKRPVNLDLSTIRLPLAAWASITHRVSGVILFVGIAILLYIFDLSLSGDAGFAEVRELAGSGLFRLILWGLLSALAYHMVAGIKHLLLDLGIGESREGGPLGARIVIAASILVMILLGVWIW
jgi:succinate dehydrogenase / fumarate reductase cytochrome b subunit